MIDYGIYEVQKDGQTNKYIVTEQLEGRTYESNNLEGIIAYIENSLKKVKEL